MTDKQKRLMEKIFKRSNRTFYSLAIESGITNPPDHLAELVEEDIDTIIKCFSHYLKK